MASQILQKIAIVLFFLGSTDALRIATYRTEAEDSEGCVDCEFMKNDPKITNLAGQRFDLHRTGTFPLVLISQPLENKTMLTLHATLDRGSTLCKTTYIKNVSLRGDWVRDMANTTTIEFRAIKASRKQDSFEIKLGQEWQKVSQLRQYPWIAVRKQHNPFLSPDLTMHMHGVTFEISSDVHTSSGAYFLNVEVTNLRSLEQTKSHVGGLLGLDHVDVKALSARSTDDQCISEEKKFNFLSTSFSVNKKCCDTTTTPTTTTTTTESVEAQLERMMKEITDLQGANAELESQVQPIIDQLTGLENRDKNRPPPTQCKKRHETCEPNKDGQCCKNAAGDPPKELSCLESEGSTCNNIDLELADLQAEFEKLQIER